MGWLNNFAIFVNGLFDIQGCHHACYQEPNGRIRKMHPGASSERTASTRIRRVSYNLEVPSTKSENVVPDGLSTFEDFFR